MNTTGKNGLAKQVASDLIRHEGFRPYAYPDPLSELMKKYPRENWGYEPARDILKRIGYNPQQAVKTGAPWTVGIGFTQGVNMDSVMQKTPALRKVEEEALVLDRALEGALPWYKTASFVTKTVLINMAFNLGLQGLLSFKNTLRFISEKNYTQAATNMGLSLWAKQVKSRATELMERMRTQQIPAAFIAKDSYD